MIESIQRLVDAFSRLPTIGTKSAWRLTLHLLERPGEETEELASCLRAVKERVTVCGECCNYAESELCEICSSPSRDRTTICVVERAVDVFTIENAGRYRGLYHVLGGVLSPLNGVTADKLHIDKLMNRVENHRPAEIILGLGGSAEAETTSLYIARLLGGRPVKVTRLARGLPAGLELEYVDRITLVQALNERTDIRYGEDSDEN